MKKISNFNINDEVEFQDGLCRNYKGKIKEVLYDSNIKQFHYSFKDIVTINHNPKYDFIPKTKENDSILECQIVLKGEIL